MSLFGINCDHWLNLFIYTAIIRRNLLSVFLRISRFAEHLFSCDSSSYKLLKLIFRDVSKANQILCKSLSVIICLTHQ